MYDSSEAFAVAIKPDKYLLGQRGASIKVASWDVRHYVRAYRTDKRRFTGVQKDIDRSFETICSKRDVQKLISEVFVIPHLSGVDANNQIDVFVNEHGGPGIQHLGLNTSNICLSKKSMQSNGVAFIEPPPTYYTQSGKLDDIVKAGEHLTYVVFVKNCNLGFASNSDKFH